MFLLLAGLLATALPRIVVTDSLYIDTFSEVSKFTISGGDDTNTVNLVVGDSVNLTVTADPAVSEDVQLSYQFKVNGGNSMSSTDDIVIHPNNLTFPAGTDNATISIRSLDPGHVLILLDVAGNDSCCNVDKAYVRLQMYISDTLKVVNAVIGWIYFVAWSISFYPQVFLNWNRRSVKGLNFDFLAFNITGFLFYSIFNTSLYFNPGIQAEFHQQNPYDIIPVEINDVVFALHATLITAITVLQCFIHDRAGQSMSLYGKLLVAGCWAFMAVSLVITLANPDLLTWLQLMYFFSYVKLGITAVKYIPQAYMNYSRKSTVGWSIANILLDFTGGSFSILQMFLIAYNFDDWQSVFLNPTKFGLGALSIIFDVIFIVQHYCLYTNRSDAPKDGYEPVNGRDEEPGLLYSSETSTDGQGGAKNYVE